MWLRSLVVVEYRWNSVQVFFKFRFQISNYRFEISVNLGFEVYKVAAVFTRIRHLLEMIRFSHTVFALPFALLAAVMAWSLPLSSATGTGRPAFEVLPLIGILLCMVFARSAAMAFNRLVDRHIDAENPRTENRHLAVGTLSVSSVVIFTVVCSLGFVASTLLFLPNRWPIYLSLPVLLFLFSYSYTKRFTSLAHFWLGAALMLAPMCVWIAIRGSYLATNPADLTAPAVLGIAVLWWVAGFDILYACQDAVFDRAVGLRSVPSRLGVPRALQVAAICHAGMVAALAILPLVTGPALGSIYYVAVLSVAVLLVYEHYLVSSDDLGRVNVAFFNVNAIVSIGLFLVVSVDLLV